ncbi:hypothetical protein [Intrasporangium oryzae]|uniref:hypothetical protein n=1 Tax=Intrasporangium oryzae TaxID=412687 RepID=UPI0012F75340|nr:hypothetical protein [Intrasporangium oryzae]
MLELSKGGHTHEVVVLGPGLLLRATCGLACREGPGGVVDADLTRLQGCEVLGSEEDVKADARAIVSARLEVIHDPRLQLWDWSSEHPSALRTAE